MLLRDNLHVRTRLGAALIGLTAILWATDGLFRFPLAAAFNPTVIVFSEHTLILLVLLPFYAVSLLRHPHEAERGPVISPANIGLFALIGAGGSALATVLFTLSFRHLNPSVAILLQKVQPVFVVLIAHGVLGERPARRFYGWAALALLSAIALSVSFSNLSLQGRLQEGAVEALLAAFVWAASTVAGKILLKRCTAMTVTFWRFAFGWLALGIWLLLAGHPGTTSWISPDHWGQLAYMALVPGLLAMVIYYAGLSRTTASIATFVELLYPLSAVCLNAWILHTALTLPEGAAAAVLVFSVFFISR
jgi:drug/metabolite transporter, DME family